MYLSNKWWDIGMELFAQRSRTMFVGSKTVPEITPCDIVGVFLWARETAMQKWKQ